MRNVCSKSDISFHERKYTMADKVLFGFKNVYYSKITESGTTITYGTPAKFSTEGAGGVSIALSPRGETFEKYADDVLWFADAVNQGYEGDLVLTNITDSFKKDIMKYTQDTNGALVESANTTFEKFALGFEVQGNEKPTRTWYYYCTVTRPNDEANTKEASMSTNDKTLNIIASPRPTDEKVKVTMKLSTTNTTAYNGFFSSVYEAQ